MKKILSMWWISVLLDWYSTIIQNYTVEENPVVRYVWENFGGIGLTLLDLFVGGIVSYIIYKSRGLKGFNIICVTFLLVIIFKILIALTNLALIPYEVLGWFNY